MYDGTLKFDTSLDASGMQKGANKLGDIVKGLGIFELLKKGVEMVAASVGQAMSRIDTMDQFNRVMSTMTGSVSETNKALTETTAIVTGTAYGLDTAAKGVQAFVSAGMKVSAATDTMKAWADATSFYTKGTNAELETVSGALQKMQTKGTVTMEHLQMLLEAGIPAIQIYASAVGKSTEEVTDQMGKGELKTSDFIKVMNAAFETGTSGFPSVAGAAQKAGQSWSGSIDNMKAAIARGTASVLTSFDKMFNVKSGIVSFGKTIEKVFKGIADNLGTIIPLIISAVAAFAAFKVIAAIPALIEAVKTAIQNVGTALTTTIGTAQIAIAAVVMLIGVIDSVSNSLDGYQKAMADTRAAEEDQIAANEAVLNSIKATNAEYEKSIAATEETGKANQNLISRLLELSDGMKNGTIAADDQAGAQREMMQITGQLNSGIDGLNLQIDTATGTLNMNADALREAASRQEDYNKAVAGLEHANKVYEQVLDAKVELDRTNSDLKTSEADLQKLQNDGASIWAKNAFQIWDWAKAGKKAADNAEDLKDQQKDLTSAVKEYARAAEAEKQENLARLQAQNSLGETVYDLAEKYGMASDEIISSMQMQGITLDDWESNLKASMTDEGLTIEQVALKWGTTAEAIQESMNANGYSLQEWETNQEDIFKKWQEAAVGGMEDVVNGFKEIPKQADMSLEDLNTLLVTNNERYASWKQNLVTASQTLGPEMMQVVESWGPGYNSLLEEYIADPSGTKGQLFYDQLKAAMDSGAMAITDSTSQYQAAAEGAGTATSTGYSTGMTAASGEPDAASQAIAGTVVKNLTSADYSGITTGIANAVKAGTGGVTTALGYMSENIVNKVKMAQTRVENIARNMMTGVSTAISSGASAVTAAAESVTSGIASKFNAMISGAQGVVRQMFSGMSSAMDEYAPALYSKARTIANEITKTLKSAFQIHSPSRVTFGIFKNVMLGAYNAMDEGMGDLIALAGDMSGGIRLQMADIPESVMVDMSNQMRSAIAGTRSDIASGMSAFVGASVVSNNRVSTMTTLAPVIQFYEPVDSPDVVAKRVNGVMKYGLAGAKR